jgi:hypothetical protein
MGMLRILASLEEETIVNVFPVNTRLYVGEDILLYDDFETGVRNWVIDRGDWHVSNGIAQGSGSAHLAILQSNWQDYLYEVTTRCRGSDHPAVDWLKSYTFFRVQNNRNFYRFGIHGDAGVIDLYKCVSGNWVKLGATSFIPKMDKWYTLSIQVKGKKIVGYLNSKKVIEATDDTFSSGGIGIGVLENEMRCDYKNVIVKRL